MIVIRDGVVLKALTRDWVDLVVIVVVIVATGPIGLIQEGQAATLGAMQNVAALTACVLLVALSVFQLCLAAGAPWGRFAWGGQHERVLPTRLRVGSAVSVLVYAAFAVVLLDRAGVVDLLPAGVAGPASWVLTAYFALGVLMNGISRSRSERAVMTPVVLVLAVCSLVVSLGA